MIIHRIMALVVLSLFASCSSTFMSNRRFINEMEHDDGMFVPQKDFRVIAGDEGRTFRNRSEIFARTPGSSFDKKRYQYEASLENELYTLEVNQPREFARHYEEYKDKLVTQSEKIYFLNLRSIPDREEYLRGRGILSQTYKASAPEVSFAIQNREIVIGMSKDEVRDSWGRPDRVDVAGNPRLENERWTFYRRGKLRQVFFERGAVQGWDID